MVPVEMVGVDPAVEPKTFRYVQTIQGRYLRAGEPGALVVGRAIADRLSADLDDQIVATAVGPNGDIENAMFQLVGIVSTGSEDGDAAVCQVALADLEKLTGLPGAGEVSIVLQDYRQIESSCAARAPGRSRRRAADAVRAGPGDRRTLRTGCGLLALRGRDHSAHRDPGRRQCAVGCRARAPARVRRPLRARHERLAHGAGLIVQEALILGGGGALVALVAGLPLVWQLSHAGLDFRRYMGESYTFQGVLFDPLIRGDFGWWIVAYVCVVALGATTVASVYPQWYRRAPIRPSL